MVIADRVYGVMSTTTSRQPGRPVSMSVVGWFLPRTTRFDPWLPATASERKK